MNAWKRRRDHRSPSRSLCLHTVDIQGSACLCFTEDGTTFQGYIIDQDKCVYGIIGQRVEQNASRHFDGQTNGLILDTNINEIVTDVAGSPRTSTMMNGEEVTLSTNGSDVSCCTRCVRNNVIHKNTQTESNLTDDDKCELEGIPVVYDITVIDDETGTSYPFLSVPGKNGKLCSLQCQEISFRSEHVYKGMKADQIIQEQLGSSKLVRQNCHVFAGPMKISYCENNFLGKN